MHLLKIIDLQIKIGVIIRQKRLAKNWTQHQLALEMLKDRQSVNRVEQGRTRITLRTLLEYADALGIHYKDLLP